MVTSVHLATVPRAESLRLLRRPPRAEEVPGLRYAETVAAAPLSPHLLPAPKPGRVGLIAAWDDDAALDGFLAGHPSAAALAGGYSVRLRPARIVGAWPQLGDLNLGRPGEEQPVADGPVAVLTLGRLRLRRAVAFLRASAKAEGDALASPALTLATGLARPPRLVATFSVWRALAPMRDYVEHAGGGHRSATTRHAARPFHHQSAFIRFEPYDQTGDWETPH
jgi:hypothetical protein